MFSKIKKVDGFFIYYAINTVVISNSKRILKILIKKKIKHIHVIGITNVVLFKNIVLDNDAFKNHLLDKPFDKSIRVLHKIV